MNLNIIKMNLNIMINKTIDSIYQKFIKKKSDEISMIEVLWEIMKKKVKENNNNLSQ